MRKHKWNTRVNAFEHAAIQVLLRVKRPLTIREITEQMLQDDLVAPSGKTPERSLYAIIIRSNKRAHDAGKRPTFRVHRGPRRNVRYSLSRSSK